MKARLDDYYGNVARVAIGGTWNRRDGCFCSLQKLRTSAMTRDAQRAYDEAQRVYDEVEARRARMEARDIFDQLDGVPVDMRRVNDAMRDEVRRAWNDAQRDLFRAQDALLKARRDQADNDPWLS